MFVSHLSTPFAIFLVFSTNQPSKLYHTLSRMVLRKEVGIKASGMGSKCNATEGGKNHGYDQFGLGVGVGGGDTAKKGKKPETSVSWGFHQRSSGFTGFC